MLNRCTVERPYPGFKSLPLRFYKIPKRYFIKTVSEGTLIECKRDRVLSVDYGGSIPCAPRASERSEEQVKSLIFVGYFRSLGYSFEN